MVTVSSHIVILFHLDFGNPYATSYILYVRTIAPKSLDGGTRNCCDTLKSICEHGRKYAHRCYYGQRFDLHGRAQDSRRCCILRRGWRLWLSSTFTQCLQLYMVKCEAMHSVFRHNPAFRKAQKFQMIGDSVTLPYLRNRPSCSIPIMPSLTIDMYNKTKQNAHPTPFKQPPTRSANKSVVSASEPVSHSRESPVSSSPTSVNEWSLLEILCWHGVGLERRGSHQLIEHASIELHLRPPTMP